MQLLAAQYRKSARKRRNFLEVRCYYEVADIIEGRQPAVGTIEANLSRLALLMPPQGVGDIYKNAANGVYGQNQSPGGETNPE